MCSSAVGIAVEMTYWMSDVVVEDYIAGDALHSAGLPQPSLSLSVRSYPPQTSDIFMWTLCIGDQSVAVGSLSIGARYFNGRIVGEEGYQAENQSVRQIICLA
jgi:hypothetical protein